MTTLTDVFSAALGRTSLDEPGLEAWLANAVETARRAWPDLAVPTEVFVAHLATRLRDDDPPLETLAKMHVTDLYLACACARGDAAAITAFDARCFRDVSSALRAMKLDDALLDEVTQQLRVQLFVAHSDAVPDIALYRGVGELRLWVRTVGVRAAFRVLRRERRATGDAEATLLSIASEADDPELEQLKARSAADFKAAFLEAVAALGARERNLLRHHIVDGLTVEQVGRIYRVHRATAARWIAAARERLMRSTQRNLRARLELDAAQIASLVRLVRSQLDISICRVLGSQKDADRR
jgi:RNA polymerase sigma-70 factor (ECF subfamily)